MTTSRPSTASRALTIIAWGLGITLLVVLGLVIWFSIGLQSANKGAEDEAERSVRENAEKTMSQLRQRAEDGELTDADIAESTGASQSVRAVNRTTEEITITSELIGVGSGVFGSQGSELCVVFTFKQPLGRDGESSYREIPSCPETRFSPTTQPSQS